MIRDDEPRATQIINRNTTNLGAFDLEIYGARPFGDRSAQYATLFLDGAIEMTVVFLAPARCEHRNVRELLRDRLQRGEHAVRILHDSPDEIRGTFLLARFHVAPGLRISQPRRSLTPRTPSETRLVSPSVAGPSG